MPALCDDVLLVVFSNLNLQQLYKVGQCSRHFQTLSRSVFKTALDGRLVLQNEMDDNERMEILHEFGALAKHVVCKIDAHEWPVEWQYVNVEQLESMHVDITQMLRCCEQTTERFEQLEHLILCSEDDVTFSRCHVDFRLRFPKLKSLKSEPYVEMKAIEWLFPSGLQSLELHPFAYRYMSEDNFLVMLRLNDKLRDLRLHEMPIQLNKLIDTMVECETNLTLETLVTYDGCGNADNYQLSKKLLLFQQLTSLEIWAYENVCTSENLKLFRRLQRLEFLTISGRTRDLVVPSEILTAIATNIPLNIKKLSVIDCGSIEAAAWTSFVAAVPAAFRANFDEDKSEITLQRI